MASERKEQTQPVQQIFVPMTCALMAWQLQSSTLTTLASKPTSRDRLLGAGHHDWKLKSNNIVLALPLLGGVQNLLLLPDTGPSPQTPRQLGDAMLTAVVNEGFFFCLLQKALKYFDHMRHFQKCWRSDGM